MLYNYDSYDEDFVIEDEADDQNDEFCSKIEIPIGLTAFASAKPSELFRYAMSWMIRVVLLSPLLTADEMPEIDEVAKLAFRRLGEEFRAMAQSGYVSDMWRESFRNVLYARPTLEVVYVPKSSAVLVGTGNNLCEACGKTNHPARSVIRFSGRPYDPDTMKALRRRKVKPRHLPDDEEAVTAGNENQIRDVDLQGNVLVCTSHQFHVGRHCLKNTVAAHKLYHWRYEMFHLVADTIRSHAKILEGGNDPDPEEVDREVDRILIAMDQGGDLTRAFVKYKQMTSRVGD